MKTQHGLSDIFFTFMIAIFVILVAIAMFPELLGVFGITR